MFDVKTLSHTQGRIVRETTAPFIHIENDEETETEIRVQYVSLSIVQADELKRDVDQTDTLTWIDMLMPILHALPDFQEKGKPAKITREFLSEFNVLNLQAIFAAIQEDVNRPKSRSKTPQGG